MAISTQLLQTVSTAPVNPDNGLTVVHELADESIPLSARGSTRLRQLLARPGIVVSVTTTGFWLCDIDTSIRPPPAFAMVSALAVLSRLASPLYTKGKYFYDFMESLKN